MSRHQQKTATPARSATVKPPSEPKAMIAPGPNGHAQKAISLSVELIQLRAYEKWELAGKPQGKDMQFWLDAEQELLLTKKVGSA
jgi:hypothetical protein